MTGRHGRGLGTRLEDKINNQLFYCCHSRVVNVKAFDGQP